MADENTSQMLVNIGTYLQLILFIVFMVLGAFSVVTSLPLLMIPIFGMMAMMYAAIYLVFGIFGLIIFFLWWRWRHDIPGNKTNLLITSILGLILAGGLPGLLVLIGVLIYPSG